MKVRLQLPPGVLAQVSYLKDQRELVIEPVFTAPNGKVTLAWVTVLGENGRQRRATIDLGGATGRLSASEVGGATATFDALPAAGTGEDGGEGDHADE